MRVAITGTGGRVGAALARRLSGRHQVTALDRVSLDLADAASLTDRLDALDCDVFVNPAGITGLEACEDDPDLARRVNVEAPQVIADWAAARGVRVIQFSTDYVLGGASAGLHDESERPQPLSVYGRSKLEAERAVLAHPGNLVLRVSWVFGPEKPSFVDKVLADARSGNPLAAVADKFSLPTFTADLAGWVERLLETDASGVMHACNSGEPVSWCGLAEETLRLAAESGWLENAPGVVPLELDSVAAFRAARPRHTAMATGRLAEALGGPPRPWQAALADYLNFCFQVTARARARPCGC